MPLVKVGVVSGKTQEYRKAVLQGIREALKEAVGVPDDAIEQVLYEVEGDFSSGEPERGVVIEITLFAGRSPEIKGELYRTIARNLGQNPGIAAKDLVIALYEIPRENWGTGGRPAE